MDAPKVLGAPMTLVEYSAVAMLSEERCFAVMLSRRRLLFINSKRKRGANEKDELLGLGGGGSGPRALVRGTHR